MDIVTPANSADLRGCARSEKGDGHVIMYGIGMDINMERSMVGGCQKGAAYRHRDRAY